MRRVTIKDIAQIAGVSYSTVSRALSGSPEISEETRTHVLEICKREGYRANVLARSLISNKTNVLGLIVPDVTNPFYSEVALEIELYARKLGYHVMLCNSLQDDSVTETLFEFLLGHQVDGIILASSRSEAVQWVQKYTKIVPTVLLGACEPNDTGSEINSVSIDNRVGGRLAAEYLLSLGHKKILYLGERAGSVTHRLRFQGFSSVIENAGLSLRVVENTSDSSSIERGYELSQPLFAKGLQETAIFAATDSLALGVLQAADEYGMSAPEDFSLLGFDNIIYSALPKITFSTIDQQKSLLAESSVNLIRSIIDSPRRDEYTHRLIRPTLVARKSCKKLETSSFAR